MKFNNYAAVRILLWICPSMATIMYHVCMYLIKQAQAREFSRVASIRLYMQQEMLRQQQERQQQQVDELDLEFQDFTTDSFLLIHLTENELVDIVIDMKIQGVEVEQTKQERCMAWVMNHSKY